MLGGCVFWWELARITAMILATKLRNGVTFELDGKPYKVTDYKHTHMSRGGGTVKVKVRDLSSGVVSTKTFKSTEKFDDIDVSKRVLQYLYKEDKEYIFMDPRSFEQIEIGEKVIGESGVFLKEGEDVNVLYWDDKALDVDLPPKIEFTVVDAAPGEKGDSASNVYKDAELENGLKVRVPLFINKGDKVRIDTRTSEYVERSN